MLIFSDEYTTLVLNNMFGNDKTEPSSSSLSSQRQDEFIPSFTLNIPEIVCNAIDSTPSDIRKDMYRCVVLAGGNTMWKDFPRILQEKLKLKYGNPHVNALQAREHITWRGLTTLSLPDKFWISREAYEESGIIALHTASSLN